MNCCPYCSEECPCKCCLKIENVQEVKNTHPLPWVGDKTLETIGCCLQPKTTTTTTTTTTIKTVLGWIGDDKTDFCCRRRFSYKPPKIAINIPTLFNTGVDNNKQVLPENEVDPHYRITSGPGITIPFQAPIYRQALWFANDSISKWLTIPGGPALEGDYIIETTFDLTGFYTNVVSLIISMAADNRVTDVLLNDMSTGLQALDQNMFYTGNINTGFFQGVNTLKFLVHNDAPVGGINPSGFRATLSGTAVPY